MSTKPSRAYLRDYDTWSFGEKSLKGALYISLMWHVFWFFSVNIVISPSKNVAPSKTKTSIVGPALDDSLFRSIVESRVEESEAYYDKGIGFSDLNSGPIRTMEKQETGQIVSIPFGRRFLTSFRQLIGGEKISPEEEFASRIATGYKEEDGGLGEQVGAQDNQDNEYYSLISGEAAARRVLTTPAPPSLDTLIKYQNISNLDIEYYLSYSGHILRPKVVHSSGDTSIDAAYLNYFRNWLFEPSLPGRRAEEYGVVRFDLGRKKRNL